jgi:hypothetical protein
MSWWLICTVKQSNAVTKVVSALMPQPQDSV